MSRGRIWGILITGPTDDVTVRDVEIVGVSSGIFFGTGSKICGTLIDNVEINLQDSTATMLSGQFLEVFGIRLSNVTCGSWIRNTYISGGFSDTSGTYGPANNAALFATDAHQVKNGVAIDVHGEDTQIDGCWINNFKHGSNGANLSGGMGVRVMPTAKRTTITDLSATSIGWHAIAVAGTTMATNGFQARNVHGAAIWFGDGAYEVGVGTDNSYSRVDSSNFVGPGFPAGLDAGLFVGYRDSTLAGGDTVFIKRLASDLTMDLVD
jgi:hypothetical protein